MATKKEKLNEDKATKPTRTATKEKKTVAKKESPAKKTVEKKKPTTRSNKVKLTFQIIYSTRFGQSIFLVGNHPALGGNSDDKAKALEYVDKTYWAITVDLDKNLLNNNWVKYYYVIKNKNGSIEKSAFYQIDLSSSAKTIIINDAWNYEGFEQDAFSSDVFKVLNAKSISAIEKKALKKGSHQFKIKAPVLDSNQAICILGSHKVLGNWDTQKPILLFPDQSTGYWTINIDLYKVSELIEYKYGIFDLKENAFLVYEEGENRHLLDNVQSAKNAILNDGFLRTN